MENISIGEFIGEYTGKLTMDNFNKASVQNEYAMEIHVKLRGRYKPFPAISVEGGRHEIPLNSFGEEASPSFALLCRREMIMQLKHCHGVRALANQHFPLSGTLSSRSVFAARFRDTCQEHVLHGMEQRVRANATCSRLAARYFVGFKRLQELVSIANTHAHNHLIPGRGLEDLLSLESTCANLSSSSHLPSSLTGNPPSFLRLRILIGYNYNFTRTVIGGDSIVLGFKLYFAINGLCCAVEHFRVKPTTVSVISRVCYATPQDGFEDAMNSVFNGLSDGEATYATYANSDGKNYISVSKLARGRWLLLCDCRACTMSKKNKRKGTNT
ncbi:hypothetical protein GQ600_13863 [Phytophthora cactorum]|nr:hypothetical protein GQ600_13863 [Phytophthora cactorum]